ncbi:Aste57867_9234 [Aphanomyces stellatus]|uniref:Aste57867_9234 protein n=1 Tax=Aphanomyces stellatus TaxID=120398 RepID=A0A485KMI2_9STRA|nr:hypothetical protein As57867_009198 [Aphanomyces stellatus]VFT86117.1 Aste57867_9234 [Aphanomyces stellatus]
MTDESDLRTYSAAAPLLPPPPSHPASSTHFVDRLHSVRGKAPALHVSAQMFEDDEQDILRHLLDIESTSAAPLLDKGGFTSSFAAAPAYHQLHRFHASHAMMMRPPAEFTLPAIKLARGWHDGLHEIKFPPVTTTPTTTTTAASTPTSDAAAVDLAKAMPVKKPHECSICHKRFRAKSELITHERIHTGHKPFKCMYEGCTKRFAHSSNLGAHHKAHQGIKPYICMHDGCGKRYAHSGSLKEHVWKHYGVKPFKCSHVDCDRTFTQRSNYSRHMKKCHGLEKETNHGAAMMVPPAMAALDDDEDDDGDDDESGPEIKHEVSYM